MKRYRSIILAAFAGCVSIVLASPIQAEDWSANPAAHPAVQLRSCCTPDHTATWQPGLIEIVENVSTQRAALVETAAREEAILAGTIPQTPPNTASAAAVVVLIGILALAAFAVLGIRKRNANLSR